MRTWSLFIAILMGSSAVLQLTHSLWLGAVISMALCLMNCSIFVDRSSRN
jgi:hypothetical protein